jgi:hypothetical protein
MEHQFVALYKSGQFLNKSDDNGRISEVVHKAALQSGALLEELILAQTFPVFYGTQMFIAVFTRSGSWTVGRER